MTWGGRPDAQFLHPRNGEEKALLTVRRGRLKVTLSVEGRPAPSIDRTVGEGSGHTRLFHGFSQRLRNAQHTVGAQCTSAECMEGGMTTWETRSRVLLCLLTEPESQPVPGTQ